jgi:hypothetical protein
MCASPWLTCFQAASQKVGATSMQRSLPPSLPGIRSALMPLLRFAGVAEQALLEPDSEDADADSPPSHT